MKIIVHGAMCVASGNCGLVAPGLFQNREENHGFVELLQMYPSQDVAHLALEAEYLCPSGSIQVDEHKIPVEKLDTSVESRE